MAQEFQQLLLSPLNGLACYGLITGTTNGDKLHDFLRGSLIPSMLPFPGEMSILIVDSCSIIHVQEVKDLKLLVFFLCSTL